MLALYVVSAILRDTAHLPGGVVIVQPPPPTIQPIVPTPAPSPTVPAPTRPTPSPTVAYIPPEPRTLLAANGAILKFVSGIPYHLKVRNGRSTYLHATQGTMKLISGADGSGACVDSLHFLPESSNGPWHEVGRTLRACDGDAIVSVVTSP